MQKSRDILFKKIIDLIYGERVCVFADGVIDSFREKLSQWKSDPTIIGPLQPPNILSHVHMISEQDVLKVSKELSIELPKEINLGEFKLDSITEEEARDYLLQIEGSINQEEEIIEILSSVEKKAEAIKKSFRPSNFEYIDMTDGEEYDFEEIPDSAPLTFRAITYLKKMIDLFEKNEVHSMTMVTLLKDGSASVWIPPYVEDKDVETLYDPLIEVLKHAGNVRDKN
jgi:hypothetical protein